MLSLVVVIVSGQMLLMFSSHCMSSCREDGFIRREREMHGSMAGFARVVGGRGSSDLLSREQVKTISTRKRCELVCGAHV